MNFCRSGVLNKGSAKKGQPSGWPFTFSLCASWACFCVMLALTTDANAQSQVFSMNCDVQGAYSDQPDQKTPSASIKVEIQSIGKNIFLNLTGSKLYEMRISSLVTEKNQGKNLTNAVHLGVNSKSLETGLVSEIVISRDKVVLQAFKESLVSGHANRLNFQGPCQLP